MSPVCSYLDLLLFQRSVWAEERIAQFPPVGVGGSDRLSERCIARDQCADRPLLLRAPRWRGHARYLLHGARLDFTETPGDVLREVRAGFNFGKVLLDGIGDYKGKSAYVEFQNENLTAAVEGEILATTPDLICLVDTETFQPVPTDALKYGKRVMVAGLPCYPLWRTPEGLKLVGPRYFGIDTDYIPLEERCKGGNA